MPQCLNLTLVHLIFSTRDRLPYLTSDIRPELHAYLASICRYGDGECYRVGGVEDHVHLAIRLPRTVSVTDMVHELKSASARWVKSLSPTLVNFGWQQGFGAFSVGPRDLDSLIAYIDGQEEQHRVRSFREEYVEYLRQYGIHFDERQLWD